MWLFVRWATATVTRLLRVPVCSVSPNCFLEGRRWKGSTLFYISISVGSDRQSWLFCGLSEGMDLVSVKCHLIHMGFCFVLGHDRDDTSTHHLLTPPLLSAVLLLIRRCSAEAHPSLLPCKYHNWSRSVVMKCVSSLLSFFSSHAHIHLLSFFYFFPYFLARFLSFSLHSPPPTLPY